MRKFFLTGLILVSAHLLNAQVKAITETGEEVFLYDDGTWKYVDNNSTLNSEIPVNDTKFIKDKNSSFLVKSKKLNFGIWINPKEWSFTKGTDSDAFEFQFVLKGEDLYAMLITEKMQIPLESLKGIALENAKNVAPDTKIIKEEYRTVNGIQLLMMQMTGTIQGMRFVYYGYYYSNQNGTVQLLAYTGENLLKNYVDEIELFLNGFVEN
ncbi:MAG: hypothetical protein F9K37_08835 [Bacteroidales bacterium]|nr:MAG: hypothetical protein F9K37_08835 [Bacteroidales bacterium]